MIKATRGIIALAGLTLTIAACNKQQESLTTASGLDPEKFVSEYQGKPTALFSLKNANGMEVCITNFGGRIVSIMVPDRDGVFKDVVLGFDSVQAYFPENNFSDFGASIGRYANRINQGKLVIDGDTIQLPQNNFGHCLHGGPSGWQYKVYDAELVNDSTLVLSIDSPDGDNNFPGNVTAKVTYTLCADNAIDIAYEATTDKTTVVNMTNHSYFNLNGNPEEPITNNILTINAAKYTPVDSTYMTTGEILDVADTPMDFTAPKEVGADIMKVDFQQIKNGNGYDHNWVLDAAGDDSQVAASLFSPSTGIKLEVLTNEPGIQVYSGNFLDGTITGKHGIKYQQRSGICLETQKYPDAPNKPDWPSAILKPGETYRSHCIFRFSIVK